MKSANPINFTIPYENFKKANKYRIYHNCSESELLGLAEILPVNSILLLSFKGIICATSDKNYRLTATIESIALQTCGVTLAPTKTKLNFGVERFYTKMHRSQRKNPVISDIHNKEAEHLGEKLNIGDLILEELSLEVPEYPRRKNARFDGVSVTKDGLRPLQKESNTPLSLLKNLME